MSHLLTVSDPWFGDFVLIKTGSSLTDQFLIGPLYLRSMRLETIGNQGKRARFKDSIEKPCQHSYVEGTVEGEVPADSPWNRANFDWDGNNLVWFSLLGSDELLRDETYEIFEGGPKGHLVYSIVYSCEETDLGATATIQMHTYFDVEGWVGGDFTHTIVLNFLSLEYPDGSKRFSLSSHSYEFSGFPSMEFQYSAEQVASPFGYGGDMLGELYNDMTSVMPQLEELVLKAGKKVHLRDAAIYDALDTLQIGDLNPIEELNSILEPLAPLRQLYQLIRSSTSFLSIIKNLASLHLFYKYVVKCGLMGAGEWRKMLDVLRHPEKFLAKLREGYLVGRGEQSKSITIDDTFSVTVRHNVKLRYGVHGVDPTVLLNLIGLTPRVADLWDVIPYSFVLDWVIPLGDAMANMEKLQLSQNLPFLSGISSIKVVGTYARSFLVNGHKYAVNLRYVTYNREIWDEFPTDVWFGVSFSNPKKQLLTGGALAIQYWLQ